MMEGSKGLHGLGGLKEDAAKTSSDRFNVPVFSTSAVSACNSETPVAVSRLGVVCPSGKRNGGGRENNDSSYDEDEDSPSSVECWICWKLAARCWPEKTLSLRTSAANRSAASPALGRPNALSPNSPKVGTSPSPTEKRPVEVYSNVRSVMGVMTLNWPNRPPNGALLTVSNSSISSSYSTAASGGMSSCSWSPSPSSS